MRKLGKSNMAIAMFDFWGGTMSDLNSTGEENRRFDGFFNMLVNRDPYNGLL